MIGKAHFFGNPFIGVFSVANDNLALCPLEDSGKFSKTLKQILGVDVVKTNIADSPIIGVYVAMNNYAAVLPELTLEKEYSLLKELFEVVYVSPLPYNAWGNNLVINSKGGIINPELEKEIPKLQDVLGIEIVPMEIAAYKTVGSAVVANDKGFVITYKAKEEEIKAVEDVLGVKGRKTSINMGSPLPHVGLVANNKGAIVGEMSSGVEVANVEEGLDIIEVE